MSTMKVLLSIFYCFLFEVTVIFVNLIWFKYFSHMNINTRFLLSIPLIILSQYFILRALQYSTSFVVANIFLMFFAVTGSYVCDYIVKKKMITNVIDILLILAIAILCVVLTIKTNNT